MRLAPGRTYLRYGCVLDLKTVPGRIDALVMGEHLYEVCIQASPPDEEVLARAARTMRRADWFLD